MKTMSLVMIFNLLLCSTLWAQLESTCKVISEQGVGTGTFYKEDKEFYWVITAAHVLNGQHSLFIKCYHSGFESEKIPTSLHWKFYKKDTVDDVAILKVSKQLVKERGMIPPKIIPLFTEDFKPAKHLVVKSCGCANGSWPTMWKGHLTSVSDKVLMFIPTPLPGRSGAALVYEKKIVGIIIFQNGKAISIKRVYELMKDE